MQVSVSVSIHNTSPNYEASYQKCESFLIISIKAVTNMTFAFIGKRAICKPHVGLPLSSDGELSAPYLIGDLIFKKIVASCLLRANGEPIVFLQ